MTFTPSLKNRLAPNTVAVIGASPVSYTHLTLPTIA